MAIPKIRFHETNGKRLLFLDGLTGVLVKHMGPASIKARLAAFIHAGSNPPSD
jgi:hypothetical protein